MEWNNVLKRARSAFFSGRSFGYLRTYTEAAKEALGVQDKDVPTLPRLILLTEKLASSGKVEKPLPSPDTTDCPQEGAADLLLLGSEIPDLEEPLPPKEVELDPLPIEAQPIEPQVLPTPLEEVKEEHEPEPPVADPSFVPEEAPTAVPPAWKSRGKKKKDQGQTSSEAGSSDPEH